MEFIDVFMIIILHEVCVKERNPKWKDKISQIQH